MKSASDAFNEMLEIWENKTGLEEDNDN